MNAAPVGFSGLSRKRHKVNPVGAAGLPTSQQTQQTTSLNWALNSAIDVQNNPSPVIGTVEAALRPQQAAMTQESYSKSAVQHNSKGAYGGARQDHLKVSDCRKACKPSATRSAQMGSRGLRAEVSI